MGERWATFDCYGTLVDWNGGIRDELARLFGEGEAERLLARYHELEPQIQVEDPSRSYRHVLVQALERLAAEEGVSFEDGDRDALPRSLPSWPVFAEVPGALEEARTRGWRLGILSNTDPDLIAASVERIGVPFDDVIAASSIGSYKPALGHWRAFERNHGRLPDVHVAASLFHDIAPARELGLPSVWVNRLAEDAGSGTPSREIGDLSPLPDVLDEIGLS